VWCGVPNSGGSIATGTHGHKRRHEANLTRSGRSRWDGRNRYGLWRVECHGSVVGRRCLLAKVAQRHAYNVVSPMR
jgi:hypothetical protein